MSKSRIMFNMTVQEVREGLKETQTVLLPVGVVEQHGYHLPLSVDIHNAVIPSEMASELCGCFVAPALNYSFSGGTLPGTINISPQMFSMLLMEIFNSLIVGGFKNIVVVMGHGATENVRASYEAAENYQRLNPQLSGITISVTSPFGDFSPTYMKGFREESDFHAAKGETSLMLYWKPELVKMDKACYDTPEITEMMRTDQDAFLVKHKEVDSELVIPKLTQHPGIAVGVMGSFEGASAEYGEIVAKEAAQGLAEYVCKLEGRKLSD